MDAQVRDRIQKLVEAGPVFMFMKGDPTFPQCGFSNQVTQILKSYKIPFGHCDVLKDPEIRQGIKDFSDWPTIPQVYVSGEFIGGCDIIRESWETGELTDILQKAFTDRKIVAPEPPAQTVDISPAEARKLLDAPPEDTRFLDVRSPEECDIASLAGFEMLDQELAQEIVKSHNKEAPLVFLCHLGGRSKQAAQWFATQGFQKTLNVQGGIDAWAETVDTGLTRY